jgi:D-lactate dehydrogenase
MHPPADPALIKDLQSILPGERIRSRYIDRVTFASDAGFYSLIPRAVVQPVDEGEVQALFRLSQDRRLPLVFRAGGTSLSGQSITDGILVDLASHWKNVRVDSSGRHVRVQPGVTGSMVNLRLRSHGRKIGPDPSSISSAMMGGILSNNSSGMCCGVAQNAYHTLRFLRFVLPDGRAYTTESQQDYELFRKESAALYEELAAIRREILANPSLKARIREKYGMKNTVGYSLNAFVDHEDPLDIFAHLLIGAEGTLAFISEAVLDTVHDHPCKSTALLYFPDILAACRAIGPLNSAGAAMAELMDRASLRAVQDLPGMPSVVRGLSDAAAALLVEFQEPDEDALRSRVNEFMSSLEGLTLLHAPVFTEDAKERDFLWKVRKGLFPAVGAVRASGTTVVLEDLAFPVDRLGEAVLDLQALFRKYGYDNAIIFGHARDGNIHFVVTQSFGTEEDVAHYDRFLREVVDLVVHRYDGTLKAEHGTGRNMAPFVETEWGGEAYAILKRIKGAADPWGLLNPGVIINDDAEAHIRNLKSMPVVEEEVDRCIECGYCEHRCPSRDLTMTPRRRIVARRVLEDLRLSGDRKSYKKLLDEYRHDGLDTCAVDGLCATACPVDINTGDLVKRLRRESHSPFADRVALLAARNFGLAESGARMLLGVASGAARVLGHGTLTGLTRMMRRIAPGIPLWKDTLTAPPSLKPLTTHRNPPDDGVEETVVYFPACLSRLMGRYPGRERNLMETFLDVCSKSGIGVVVPEGLHGTCCSQIFSSKGHAAAHREMANRVVDVLWRASREGALPVVTDVSSCAYTLGRLRPVLDDERKGRFDRLTCLDSVEFLHDRVMPRVGVSSPLDRRVVLHPVCSLEKMGTESKWLSLARRCAREVVVPASAGCCGMAGDRGFLVPELTSSATRIEAAEVSKEHYDGYYSSTRTCEMAMSEAVGRDYESILYLVDDLLSSDVS